MISHLLLNTKIVLKYKDIQISKDIAYSVVECSPATRAARVRFPDDAKLFSLTEN